MHAHLPGWLVEATVRLDRASGNGAAHDPAMEDDPLSGIACWLTGSVTFRFVWSLRREGAVIPATTSPSPVRRLRTVALAATIALSTMIPSITVLQAQDAGFEVTVESVDDLSGLTAVVTGSDDGLRLRAEPAQDAEVLETLPDGTVVTLRIDMLDTVMDPDGTTRWWPVTANGVDGWVSGFYLEATEAAASPGSDGTDASTPEADASTETPDVTSSTTESTTNDDTSVSGEGFSFNGDTLTGATAQVAGGGGSVNLRSEPSSSADLVTTLSDGAIVTLRIDTTDTVLEGDIRWWPVAIDGFEGWVSGQYLTDASSTDAVAEGTTEASSGAFVAGSYAEAHTGDGDGVNLRAEAAPDAPLLETVPEGTVLQILEGPLSFEASEAGWFRVTTGSTTGYVDGDLLIAATDAETSSDIPTTGALAAGDYALVVTETEAGARIRSGASPEGERIGFVPERERVEIISGPASYESSERGWYEVSYDGVTGYIDGDLLVRTEAPTPEPTVAPTATATQTTDANANLTAGEVVITQSDTGVGVNVRSQPGTTSDRTGYLADGSSLEIMEGPSQDTDGAAWYKVTNGLVEGWVFGEYLQRTNAEAPDSGTEQAAAFIAPLDDYTVTQEMGCSNLGYYVYDAAWGCAVHDGIDLATSAGTPLKASAAGTVVFSGWTDGGLGYYVEIDHGNGIHTLYGHMQGMPSVAVGDYVQQGQEIGPLGSTGLSTGPHVHFMVRVNGESVNPRDYVTFDN